MQFTLRTSRARAVCALAGWAVSCGLVMFTTAIAAQTAPQSNADRDVVFHNVKANKILFLGNSITLHGPAPAIGWEGNWGMAASSKDKDYVHLVLKAIAQAAGKEPESLIANIAGFERQSEAYNIDTELKNELAFKPDVVIVALGENVPALGSDEAKSTFKAGMDRLLKRLKENGNPTLVVRTCFWPDPAKDGILEQACKEVGGVFVDDRALGKDETNQARAERSFAHAGVAGHPGDKGMKAIADSILEALSKVGQ